jgi:hypothetical protein
VPTALAFKQSVSVLVAEVLEYVDEEESIGHPEVLPTPSRTCNLACYDGIPPLPLPHRYNARVGDALRVAGTKFRGYHPAHTQDTVTLPR